MRVRAMAAGLDALGVGRDERVAVVSQNSARLVTALFAVSGYGRIVVPINFRLDAEEVGYIVEHSGASVLLIGPELDEALASVSAEHRLSWAPSRTRPCCGSESSLSRGPRPAKTRWHPSTTRAARPRVRRVCPSPTATSA